jgi:hypothetical protein
MRRSIILPIYTFYPTRCDGSAPTFEAHELACDATALNRAVHILERHDTCQTVEIWDDDRQVGVHQSESLLRTA